MDARFPPYGGRPVDGFYGVFSANSKTRIADIRDGTSSTLLISELIVGHTCTMRGSHSYDEGPVVMVDRTPGDPTADRVRGATRKIADKWAPPGRAIGLVAIGAH